MNQSFLDTNGQKWLVEVSVGVIEDCRKLLGVDPIDPSGSIFEKIEADPVLLCNLLFVCCRGQATELAITDVDFGRAMGGDALDDGKAALTEALINFFPRNRREGIRATVQRFQQLQTDAATTIATKIQDPRLAEAVATKIDQVIDEALANMLAPKTEGTANQ